MIRIIGAKVQKYFFKKAATRVNFSGPRLNLSDDKSTSPENPPYPRIGHFRSSQETGTPRASRAFLALCPQSSQSTASSALQKIMMPYSSRRTRRCGFMTKTIFHWGASNGVTTRAATSVRWMQSSIGKRLWLTSFRTGKPPVTG